MAIVVEHDKRKKEILDTALDLFMEKGYEDVTFQKIADRCGITRTTLYIYFKNKKEIFVWSIKQLTTEIEASLMEIINDESKTVKDRLLSVLDKILENVRRITCFLPLPLPIFCSCKNQERILQYGYVEESSDCVIFCH